MFFYGQHSRLLPKAGVFLTWRLSLSFIVLRIFTLLGAAFHLRFHLKYSTNNYFPDSPGHLVIIIHHVDQLGQWFQNRLRVSIDLTWGMAQFIKMPATSLSAMYMPTQKGSSPEASPLPASSNTGGEWLLVPPLSQRVDQISFRELMGCYIAHRCRHWTRNYVTRER